MQVIGLARIVAIRAQNKKLLNVDDLTVRFGKPIISIPCTIVTILSIFELFWPLWRLAASDSGRT